MSKRTKDIDLSLRTARLWAAGKMIGGDEDAVRDDLVSEIDRLEAELAALRADAERYRWLRDSAKEELLYPARAVGDMPDLRTKWALPVLICSGPVGGFRSFDETVDAQIEARKVSS